MSPMRRYFTQLLSLVPLIAIAFFMQAPSVAHAALSDNLISYWSFDNADVSGTISFDRATTTCGNTGTLALSSTATTSHYGVANDAMGFNGTSQQLTSATSYANPQSFTISAWFKTPSASGHTIVGFESNQTGTGSGNHDRFLYMGTDGKIYFGWYDGSTRTIASTAALNNNVWHHAVGTFSAGVGYLYIDGVSQGTLTAGAAQNYTGWWRVGGYRGGWTNGSDGYFNGSIDEVMIWSRALSAAEVTSLYTLSSGAALALHAAPLSVTIAATTPTAGMPSTLGLFTVSRTSAAACALPVTFGVSGTAVSGTDYTSIGTSATIPANQSSVGITVTPLANVPNPRTVIATISPSGFYTVGSPSSNTVTLYPIPTLSISSAINGGGVATVTWSSTGTNSCTATGPNSFSSSGTSGSQTTTPGVSPATYALACSTPFGTRSATTTALAGSSIAALKNGMLNYWSLDSGDISGGVANDVSPNACSAGTLTNSPTPTMDHYGVANNALYFNGSNQYISAQPIDVTNAISVSAWVWSSNFGQNGMVVEKDPLNTEWELFFYGGYLYWRGGGGSLQVTAPAPSNNVWHHIVATQLGTSASLYIDGVLVATGTVSPLGTGTDYSANTINIGRYNSGYYFNGSIDEAMVWNRALSANEVSQLYTLSSTDAASLHSPAPSTSYTPVVENTSGYSSVPITNAPTYPYPVYSSPLSGNSGSGASGISAYPQPLLPWPLLGSATSTWYAGTPSPLTCYQNGQGNCAWLGGTQGVRVSEITATAVLASTSNASLVSGVVGWWSLNAADISSTTVNDVSVYSNSGTTAGSPTPISGHYGDANNALSFNGSSQRVDFSATPTTVVDNWTMSAWIYPAALNTLSMAVYNGNDSNGYGFGVGNGSGSAGNMLQGLFAGVTWLNSGYTFPAANQWYHVVMVRNSGTTNFYVNGIKTSGSYTNTPNTPTSKFSIGMEYNSSNVPSRYFNGAVDEVMMWNRALSQNEINSLYGLSAADALNLQGDKNIAPQSAGVDQVQSNPTNACGVPYVHWSYVQTRPTMYVPKYSTVNVSYMCQPNQEYLWQSIMGFSCYVFSWCQANTLQQRVFNYADRAKVNGVATSQLYSTGSQVVSGTANFSLQCGGYVPEEGKQVGLRPQLPTYNYTDDFSGSASGAANPLPHNVALPPYHSTGSTGACWTFCYWDWTWAFYNMASSTFYQPLSLMTVQACNDNEIVVNNVCTPCPSGQYRSGNSCINNPPPTATIDAGMGHDPTTGNGYATTTVVGTPVTIRATYTPYSSGTPVAQTSIYNYTGGSQTFIVPADVTSITVKTWGGGGGGGGNGGSGTSGAAGGGGGYASSILTVTPGESLTIDVGGGGGGASTGCLGGSGGGSTGGGIKGPGGVGGNPGSSGCSGPGGGGGGGSFVLRGSTILIAAGGGGGGGGTEGGGGPGAGGGGGVNGANSTISCIATGGTAGGSASSAGTAGGTPGFDASAGGGGGGGYLGGTGGKNPSCDSYGGAGGAGGTNYGTTVANGSGTTTGNSSDTDRSNSGSGGAAQVAGSAGIVVIKYSSVKVDNLTATAINNDNTGASVDCNLITPLNPSNCWTIPDATKTYTFTPGLADLGTNTFSAQIKTGAYPNYNGYAKVQVTVTCPPHSSGPSCTCDPHYSLQGNACVLDECTNNSSFPGIQTSVPLACTQNPDYTCSAKAGYVINGGDCVPPGPPANLVLTVNPSRVKKGSNTSLTWTGSNIPVQCVLSSSPSVPGLPATTTSSLTGSTAPVVVGPINQNTILTLTCISNGGSGSTQKIIGVVPVYREI